MTRREHGDAGATTVVFAVVVLLLFAFAALGVELTSMYARDRAVQTVADVTALSAAQQLPDACAAVATAVRTLSAEGNAVQDDDGNAQFGLPGDDGSRRMLTEGELAALAAQLSDRELVNGEVQVLAHFGVLDPVAGDGRAPTGPGDAGWLRTDGCGPGTTTAPASANGSARFVRVVVPARTVRFTFANVFTALGGTAVPSAEVRAVATAGIRAPEGASILPIALAGPCPGGVSVLLTDQGVGAVVPDPSGSADGPRVTGVVRADDPGGEIPNGFEGALEIGVSGLVGDPADAVVEVLFDFHHGRPVPRVEVAPTAVRDVLVTDPGPAPEPDRGR